MSGDREACLAAGMDDYLSKSFSAAELKGALEKWIWHKTTDDCNQTGRGDQEERQSDLASERTPVPLEKETMTSEPHQGSSSINKTMLENIAALEDDGATDLITEIIGLYLEHTPKLLDMLSKGVEQKVAQDVSHAAHSLKSQSANLGAEKLAKMCFELEKRGRAQSVEEVGGLLRELIVEYEAVRAALTSELEERAA